MKKYLIDLFPAILIAAGLMLPAVSGSMHRTGMHAADKPAPAGQDTSRDQTDYMRSLLERNPQQPLGLQENPELKHYLGQSGISWAVRSTRRHILN